MVGVTASDHHLGSTMPDDLLGDARCQLLVTRPEIMLATDVVTDESGRGGVIDGDGADHADGTPPLLPHQLGDGIESPVRGVPRGPGDVAGIGLVAGGHGGSGGSRVGGQSIRQEIGFAACEIEGIALCPSLVRVVADHGVECFRLEGRDSLMLGVVIVGGNVPGGDRSLKGELVPDQPFLRSRQVTTEGLFVRRVHAITNKQDHMPGVGKGSVGGSRRRDPAASAPKGQEPYRQQRGPDYRPWVRVNPNHVSPLPSAI